MKWRRKRVTCTPEKKRQRDDSISAAATPGFTSTAVLQLGAIPPAIRPTSCAKWEVCRAAMPAAITIGTSISYLAFGIRHEGTHLWQVAWKGVLDKGL